MAQPVFPFPQELVDLVIDHVDESQLRSCSLVNKIWCIPSQRRIWEICTVEDLHDTLDTLGSIVLQSPHIPRYIKSLKLMLRRKGSTVHERLSVCLNVLGPALMLDDLHIIVRRLTNTFFYMDKLPEVLSAPCFSRMKGLSFRSGCIFQSLGGLQTIISTFPHLTDLRIGAEWDSEDEFSPPLEFPSLKSLMIVRSPRGLMRPLYEWLLSAPSFSSLRRLSISYTEPYELTMIGGWLQRLSGLRELTLGLVILGTDGARHLIVRPRAY
jgi:hypothetical protein